MRRTTQKSQSEDGKSAVDFNDVDAICGL